MDDTNKKPIVVIYDDGSIHINLQRNTTSLMDLIDRNYNPTLGKAINEILTIKHNPGDVMFKGFDGFSRDNGLLLTIYILLQLNRKYRNLIKDKNLKLY